VVVSPVGEGPGGAGPLDGLDRDAPVGPGQGDRHLQRGQQSPTVSVDQVDQKIGRVGVDRRLLGL